MSCMNADFKEMRCRSCHHASHIDTKLLKKFFTLMREMEGWNKDYQQWIKDNERFKAENYLVN